MNRRWISKLSRAYIPAIVGTLVLTAWASVQAGTLLDVIVEGKHVGDTLWSRMLTVESGDVVEYRLLADMAPIGNANTQGTTTRTITALTPGTDGINSLILTVGQAASDGIQANFAAPGTLAAGWSGLPGFSGGNVTPRSGVSGMNNLTGIRPIRGGGDFAALDPTPILTGTFTVGSVELGETGLILPGWNSTGSGSARINNGTSIFVQPGNITAPDPMVGFAPLTLQAIPEPSTIVLVGMGLVGLLAFARRRRSA